MYPEEKSAQAEIFQIMQDDQFSELQGQSQLMEQIDVSYNFITIMEPFQKCHLSGWS